MSAAAPRSHRSKLRNPAIVRKNQLPVAVVGALVASIVQLPQQKVLEGHRLKGRVANAVAVEEAEPTPLQVYENVRLDQLSARPIGPDEPVPRLRIAARHNHCPQRNFACAPAAIHLLVCCLQAR